ncbi:MAG: signal peptidase II [Chloroflexi bacterium]|nr:signal peptidase II [Chloroflexota bacterium]
MQKSKRLALLFLILAITIGADQVTKVLAQRYLSPQSTSYLNDLFRLQLAQNNGAFLSLGSLLSDQARFRIFTIFVGLFLLGLLIYTVRVAEHASVGFLFALGLILGGGLSNLLDRVLHNGLVVDFMNIGIGNLRTGIFNVADVVLMAGLALLLFVRNQAHEDESSTAPDTSS